MTSTMASTTVKISDVFSRPTPSVSLIQSAKLSPTVVHNTLMIQNQMTTSGTLFNQVRVEGSRPKDFVVDVTGADLGGEKVSARLSRVRRRQILRDLRTQVPSHASCSRGR